MNIVTIETSETSTMCFETRQVSVLATEKMSVVETGQMSVVETRQMSAIARGACAVLNLRAVLSQQPTSVLS